MSTGFSAEWLALREPCDTCARAMAWPALGWPARPADAAPLAVADLACGTGANLRFLAPRLGGAQHWTLLDHDAALLAAVPGQIAHWAAAQGFHLREEGEMLFLQGEAFSAEVRRQRCDLARGLPAHACRPGMLLTASALLDLVSASWIATVTAQAAAVRAALLFALSVDGRVDWSPPVAQDTRVLQRFLAHQQGDKGFGPALGPAATGCMAAMLADAGYRVRRARSDWHIDGGPMAQAMRDGLAQAAAEADPQEAAAIAAWRCPLPPARLTVGHEDLLALPGPGPTAGPAPSAPP